MARIKTFADARDAASKIYKAIQEESDPLADLRSRASVIKRLTPAKIARIVAPKER